MFAAFEQSIAKAPVELELNLSSVVERPAFKTREEIAGLYRSWRPESMLYRLSNGNFMALSHENESLSSPRSIVVMDDIFCIFSGALDNTSDLRRYYGLHRQATEALIIVEAYKVLRDRAPYPPDQVIKELEGKFSFVLFDSRASVLFIARDRDGLVQLHWGTAAADGSLICSDDPKLFSAVCGNCYTPFPPGCIFLSGNGLISFDHPLHKVRPKIREDEEGKVTAILFQVDLYTRLPSIPRTGSAANWADAAIVKSDEYGQ